MNKTKQLSDHTHKSFFSPVLFLSLFKVNIDNLNCEKSYYTSWRYTIVFTRENAQSTTNFAQLTVLRNTLVLRKIQVKGLHLNRISQTSCVNRPACAWCTVSTPPNSARYLSTVQPAVFPLFPPPPYSNLHNLHLNWNHYLLDKLYNRTHTFRLLFLKAKPVPLFFITQPILWLEKQQLLHSGNISGEHLHLVSKTSNCRTKFIYREPKRPESRRSLFQVYSDVYARTVL